MKHFIAASVLAISTVSAHSWVECTNHDNSQIRGWMNGNSTLSPPVIIDPGMPWYAYQCSGWPRNKKNPGNWIEESSDYVWNINANSWDGGSYHPPDTHACHPDQRTPTYQNDAPMSTAKAGSMIRLRFGGNGHARGFNVGGNPGTVSVYWKGRADEEITDIDEFTPGNLLQSTGFSDNSFSYPADLSIKTPTQGLVDKGNWMELNLPAHMEPGRHMMVWVWYYQSKPQWSTCFDVLIDGAVQPPAPAPASPPPSSPPSPSPSPSQSPSPPPRSSPPPPPPPPPPQPAVSQVAPAEAPSAYPSPPSSALVSPELMAGHAEWNDRIAKRHHARDFT